MTYSWQPNLARELLQAGLDPGCFEHVESVETLCRTVAELVVHGYLSGKLSWADADSVINYLFPAMLECQRIPDYPWSVYEAFDAGEYHPVTPELSEDEVTRPLLLNIVERYHA